MVGILYVEYNIRVWQQASAESLGLFPRIKTQLDQYIRSYVTPIVSVWCTSLWLRPENKATENFDNSKKLIRIIYDSLTGSSQEQCP